MANPLKNKLNYLTLEQRMQIINSSGKKSQRELAKEFNCSVSSINLTIKRKLEYEKAYNNNPNSNRLRCKLRRTDAYEVNNAMEMFLLERRQSGLPVTGPLLQLQAKTYANRLGITDFKASSGWLNRFKERNIISLRSTQSESNDHDSTTVKKSKEKLPIICQDYDLEDIFNAEENGRYFAVILIFI